MAKAEEGALGWYDLHGDHCDLCKTHFDRYSDVACLGCPVMQKTGLSECESTPYYEVRGVLANYLNCVEENRPAEYLEARKKEVVEACEKEIAFLESLK